MQKELHNDQINLDKLYKTIKSYKWLILIITLITTFLMGVFLYFTPSIYTSSTIMEIKSNHKSTSPNDLLLSSLSLGSSGQIDKEIEILKTFSINEQALKKINLQVNYYKDDNYKEIEIYKNLPISISNIELYESDLIGMKFSLIPNMNTFKLKIETSLRTKISNIIFSRPSISIDEEKSYSYGKEIKNSLFKFTVKKNFAFTNTIHFKLQGTNRQVYDSIINKNLNIRQLNANAPLVEISYQDTIPSRASAYIESLSESFIEQSILSKNEQNNKILMFIDKQLKNIKGTLDTSETKLENYKISNQIIEPTMQAKTYIQKLSDIEIELSENLLKQKLTENLIIFTRHNENLDAIAPSLMELNDRPTIQLITTLQTLQLQQDELESEYTDQFPKLITVKKQINNIKRKILLNIRNLKATISRKSVLLKDKKKTYEKKIKSLPTKEKKLVNIQRDYQVSSNMYNYLLQKKTENELIIVATLSDYKVIDHAHASVEPIKPKRTIMILIAPILGLFFGIIVAIILRGLDNKITNREDFESLTNLPIYGIIPNINKKNLKLEVCENPNSPFTESYRSLRTHIQANKPNNQANIVLVTSTIASEGKTTLTSNLACIFQMAGYKSIVINLDLRKPTLHNYFNLKNDKGMSSYLSGKETIQDIIFATKYTDLHVITSGPIPENPSELLLSNRLTELLDILKTRYDYIFIDSAPVGLVSDSVQLMQLANTNIVVFRENFAETSFVESLERIIEKNNIKNIGLVLNRSNSKNDMNAYGYGYGYGYQ